MCGAGLVLPNNKTGNNCAQKSISQDGSHVPEKVPLKNTIKGNNLLYKVQDDEAFTQHQEFWKVLKGLMKQLLMQMYPFQAVTSVEDDGREQNVEEDFGIKGHLRHTKKWMGLCL